MKKGKERPGQREEKVRHVTVSWQWEREARGQGRER